MDRPTKEFIAWTGQVYGPCAAWQDDRLRRLRLMHSQMVWQAMQAVMAVACIEQAHVNMGQRWAVTPGERMAEYRLEVVLETWGSRNG